MNPISNPALRHFQGVPETTTTAPQPASGSEARQRDEVLESRPESTFANLVRASQKRTIDDLGDAPLGVQKKSKVGEGAERAPALCQSSLDQIRQSVKTGKISLTDFELWASYGAEGLRSSLSQGFPEAERMDLNELLKLGRRQIDEAICGNSANAMAQVILGRDRGEELVQTLNAHRSQRLDRPGEGCVVGRSAPELHEALKTAAESGQRAVALVHLGDSHRFLVEVQPDKKVHIFQGFIGHYRLSQWLDPRNKKATRDLDDFSARLNSALGSGDEKERLNNSNELFYKKKEKDPFDFGNKPLSFALITPVTDNAGHVEVSFKDFLEATRK